MSPKTATKTDPPTVENPTTRLEAAYRRARLAAVPIIAVETPDPMASMRLMATATIALNRELTEQDAKRSGKKAEVIDPPVVQWDRVRGLNAKNNTGADSVNVALKAFGDIPAAKTANPVDGIQVCEHLKDDTVVFILNAHRALADPVVGADFLQGVWNLRDLYKSTNRTLVLLGAYFHDLPVELQGDVIHWTEDLPTRFELEVKVAELFEAVGQKAPTGVEMRQITDAIVGLSMFTAEQVVAMALGRNGIDLALLWEHKIKAIEQTPGLKVYKPKPNENGLVDLKGVDNIRDYMQALIDVQAFGAIGLIDEGEKDLAGGMADFVGDSGVAKYQTKALLTHINDTGGIGVMLAGITGTGKTETGKATAKTAGVPMILMDLGEMKSSHIGESEARIRHALRVIHAISEGRVLWLMTANRTTGFSPEMNRRFPDQFFYDIPDEAGRKALWEVFIARNELRADQLDLPEGFDAGWTGDEIRRVCERAKLLNRTLLQASRFLIPTARAHEAIHQALREHAHRKFLSAAASQTGWYECPKEAPKVAEKAFADAYAINAVPRKMTMN
jgi:hypothetical protein